ncbi:MAG: 5-formyltetrahydrofolate cyclo-ligase, partial [Verrucomicrobiota bacterium]
MDVVEEKKRIRNEVREKLKSIRAKDCEENSSVIIKIITQMEEWKTASKVMLFFPLHNEPQIIRLMEIALAEEKCVILPKVVQDDLEIYDVNGLSDLIKGSYGIMEPMPEKCVKADFRELDYILVPGMAFDRRGNRLGRGG